MRLGAEKFNAPVPTNEATVLVNYVIIQHKLQFAANYYFIMYTKLRRSIDWSLGGSFERIKQNKEEEWSIPLILRFKWMVLKNEARRRRQEAEMDKV